MILAARIDGMRGSIPGMVLCVTVGMAIIVTQTLALALFAVGTLMWWPL